MSSQPWQVAAAQDLQARGIPFRDVTSEVTDRYNCIAWAAGDGSHWWWPNGYGYWPGRPANQHFPPTLAVFQAAFATIGFANCGGPELEADFEKIALYEKGGEITHAAFQLQNGHWTSKLGAHCDIEHVNLDDMVAEYGTVIGYMRRRITKPAPAPPQVAPAIPP